MRKIVFVVGTRPDIVKMAPVIRAAKALVPGDWVTVAHTDQHYSPELSEKFLNEFGISVDMHLAHGHSGNVAELFSFLVTASCVTFNKMQKAPLVVVYGDTLSASAVALGAQRANCVLAHVEAGLRSKDLTMPEEVARMHIDAISDMLFAPTPLQQINLADVSGKVYVTGNTIQDVIDDCDLKRIKSNTGLLTLHRRENHVYADDLLAKALDIAHHLDLSTLVWPFHPSMAGIVKNTMVLTDPILKVVEPFSHMATMEMLASSRVLLTDSGGMQEEAALLGVPTFTLRSTTERPETVSSGWNWLIHPKLASWNTPFKSITYHVDRTDRKPLRYSEVSPSQKIAELLVARADSKW